MAQRSREEKGVWSVTRSEQSWCCSGDKETATARTAALYEKKDKGGILKSLLFRSSGIHIVGSVSKALGGSVGTPGVMAEARALRPVFTKVRGGSSVAICS